MYEYHCHTTWSDGELLPIELVRRLSVLGYTTVAITDHGDASNLVPVLEAMNLLREDASLFGIDLHPGIEITHVPPPSIARLAASARRHGAEVVVVHGETPVEPVAPGTNHAACSCPDVDILAHPGLVSQEDARLAEKNRIALEITSRGGHNRTNGHVTRVALAEGCHIVVNSDAHAPHDLLDERAKRLIARGAGLSDREADAVARFNIEELGKK